MRVITTTLCTVGIAAALVLAPSSRAAAQGTDTAAATARDSTTRARAHHMRVASTRHLRVRKDYGGTSTGEVSRDTATNAAGAAAGRRARPTNPAAMGGRADSANFARPRANPNMPDSSRMRDSTMRDSTMRDSTTKRDSSGAGGTRTDSQPPRRPPGT